MHAYLITNNDTSILNDSVTKLVTKLKARKLEFKIDKIADVRELGKFTKLSLNEKTAIVISNFDELGEEAQNAFLKALEEPQEKLTYVLTAKNVNNVLPTILSRCEILEITNKQSGNQLTDEEREQVKEFLDAKAGERMKIISKITKRDVAIEFINNILLLGHETAADNQWLVIDEALKTLKNLKANGNVQLQLTNFVINVEMAD